MQVNVFITHEESVDRDLLLVVPAKPDATVPSNFHKRWEFFASLDSSDATFRFTKVEEDISKHGYCLFTA